jgi:2-keto-4-pentenoate hydratase
MTTVNGNAADQAADWLMGEHAARRRFTALSGAHVPPDVAGAYEVQEALVARRRAAQGTGIAGYKIALTTPTMRKFVGYDDSIAGQVLANGVHQSPARVKVSDYVHLLFECELAFLMESDLPVGAAPPTREEVAKHIGAVCPAFELADDRHADYSSFGRDNGETMKTLAADNAWNSGVVLGPWCRDWRGLDLGSVVGVASVNGVEVGRGTGSDVLGHPLEAMAWIARHLQVRGRTLKAGELVITGSLVASKFPTAGDAVRFAVEGLGEVSLNVEA